MSLKTGHYDTGLLLASGTVCNTPRPLAIQFAVAQCSPRLPEAARVAGCADNIILWNLFAACNVLRSNNGCFEMGLDAMTCLLQKLFAQKKPTESEPRTHVFVAGKLVEMTVQQARRYRELRQLQAAD